MESNMPFSLTESVHGWGDWSLHYRHWHNPAGDGVLVALHGAGVAGALTFAPMLPRLAGYRDVLVPDLYGAGQTRHGAGERPFEMDELADHLLRWILGFDFQDIDLAGYSFGGLVAMMIAAPLGIRRLTLIEPALMESPSWAATLARRQRYAAATDPLRGGGDAVAAVTAFLDIVSPNRSRHPRIESMVTHRLSHRPVGLAHALDAVGRYAPSLNRSGLLASLPPTLSLVGAKTPDDAHALHRAQAQCRPDWGYQVIAGVDHALPYQKPTAVADACIAWFKRGDA